MQSVLTDRVYCAPGNGGTGGLARNIAIPADDVVNLVRFAKTEKIGLVVLGPESAIAAGLADALRGESIPVFGPSRAAGRVETSKVFAKELMQKAGIPTAPYLSFTDAEAASSWAREREGRVVVKADGLALGKGVIVCDSVVSPTRRFKRCSLPKPSAGPGRPSSSRRGLRVPRSR